MKRYSYEISIEAADETEADSKMRGLCLLTSCAIIPKQPKSTVLPLTENEEMIIRYYRQGESLIQIIQRCINEPSKIEKVNDFLKN